MTRSRWLGSSRAFCALLVVLTLPGCFTTLVWNRSSDPGPETTTERFGGASCRAWFAPGDPDRLTIELRPDMVAQLAGWTRSVPATSVGLGVAASGLLERWRRPAVPDRRPRLWIVIDEEGELQGVQTDVPGGSLTMQALDVLPERGTATLHMVTLEVEQTSEHDAADWTWLRVLVTPVTVAADVVTLPLQMVFVAFFSRGC